jgi:hypothetical protein
MSVTNEQINAWLAANPGATDPTIAAAMNQYGVSTDQMAQATGLGLGNVQSRYNAVQPQPLYAGLNAQSTPEGIAAAYQQFAQGAGGDTAANQTQATDYLTGLGIGAPTIQQAYSQFQNTAGQASSPAPLTVEDLYQQYAGRGSDPGGLQYWTQRFGDTIDPNEVQTFRDSVAYNLAQEAATASGDPRRKGIVEAIDRQEPGTQPSVIPQSTTGTAFPAEIPQRVSIYDRANRPDPKNEALDRLNRERLDLYRDVFKPKEGVIEPFQGGFITNFASFDEYNTENPLERDVNYNLIKNGVYDYENATPEQRLQAIANFAPEIASAYLTPDGKLRETPPAQNQNKTASSQAEIRTTDSPTEADAITTLKNERFDNFYRYRSKDVDEQGYPVWQNYEQFVETNPIENDPDYKVIKSGVTDYKKATYEQRMKALGLDIPKQSTDATKTGGITSLAKEASAEDSKITPVSLEDLYKNFGATDFKAPPTTAGILSGFKYAKDSGLNDASLKKVMGDDAFNTYKTKFADYAKTGIANILADGKLSFDEARESVKFGRDYGYDAQKLADLTGTNKSVYDAIFKSYDDTTNTIVDRVLGADDVKTDGDKIIKALALQQQYGFTDEDLAKATDFTPAQVKSQLDPVRNFESDYNKLRTDPNLNEDQMKTFLTTSMQNPAIKQRLGSQLQPVLDELNKPPQERILGQIEGQRNALGGQYYQGVFADPKRMTEILVNKGVKSLADLGEKDKFQTTKAQAQYTSNGVPVQSSDGKNFYRTVDYGEGATDYIPVDAKDVQTTYGKYVTEGDGENSYSAFKPLSEQEQATLKDGKYQERLGTVVVNKRTGEELTDTSHALAYQRSSGGLKEKKNYLNVNFTKDGTPVLTASKERAGAGAALQQALPIIAMALPFMLPGIGAALSGMLPGAGVAASGATAAIAPTLMNQALTQGIISGGLTTLGGGQFEKGFLGGAVSPVISSGIGSLLPTGMDPNIAKTITGAGTGVVKGALQGGDFSDLLSQGVLSGLTNYGLGEATKGLNLTPQQLNFATGIALPLAQGQKVNPIKLATTLAGAAR